jgi:hypothetical protein
MATYTTKLKPSTVCEDFPKLFFSSSQYFKMFFWNPVRTHLVDMFLPVYSLWIYCHLGCVAMYYCRISPTFGGNVLLSYSRSKSKPRKQNYVLTASSWLLAWRTLKLWRPVSIFLQSICELLLDHKVTHPRWQYSYLPLWEPEILLIQYFSINSVICGICNSLISSWFSVQSRSHINLKTIRGYRMKIVESVCSI